jgi:hypothetical protein
MMAVFSYGLAFDEDDDDGEIDENNHRCHDPQ